MEVLLSLAGLCACLMLVALLMIFRINGEEGL